MSNQLDPMCISSLRSGNFEKISSIINKTNVNFTFQNQRETIQEGKGWTPLHLICENKPTLETLKYLVDECGANVNAITYTPLHLLCKNNPKAELINFLLEKGAKPNGLTFKPLHMLCQANCTLEAVKALVENGADLTAMTFTALHYYCKRKRPKLEIIRYLLEKGSPVTNKNKKETPLQLVLRTNPTKELLKLLLDFGSDINHTNRILMTPLHLLCKNYPSIELMEQMIALGADPNTQTSTQGNTPLHTLIQLHHLRMDISPQVHFLLRAGTNPQLQNRGKKPIGILSNESINCSKLKKIFNQKYQTMKEDFEILQKRAELTDYKILGLPVHKILLEIRTGKDIETVEKILLNYEMEDIQNFFNWVYTGIVSPFLKIREMCEKFGITNPHSKTLAKDLKTMYDDDETKDFAIKVKNEEVRVHKIILQARSELFRGMFVSVTDNSNSVSDYSDRSLSTIQMLVKFLYYDVLEFPKNADMELICEELDDAIEYYQLNEYSALRTELNFYLTSLDEKK
ncbi:ankyrin repeat-containing protein [Anaeramoeba flamelloides]|uniref:Ankyrin repeat-containing protein n=1 Tax=Anaeramoeba flamelloides TaxID=1746091 RepID=A0ABQ8XSA4_9EUKA|nr:ankyrin repeat-containing protein [Anaeramoeba flamelloides]